MRTLFLKPRDSPSNDIKASAKDSSDDGDGVEEPWNTTIAR